MHGLSVACKYPTLVTRSSTYRIRFAGYNHGKSSPRMVYITALIMCIVFAFSVYCVCGLL